MEYRFHSRELYKLNNRANRAINNIGGNYTDLNKVKADMYRLSLIRDVIKYIQE